MDPLIIYVTVVWTPVISWPWPPSVHGGLGGWCPEIYPVLRVQDSGYLSEKSK